MGRDLSFRPVKIRKQAQKGYQDTFYGREKVVMIYSYSEDSAFTAVTRIQNSKLVV